MEAYPYGLCCDKLLIVTIIAADFVLQDGENGLVHKCMTVSWLCKCLWFFLGETFCRIPWGSPFLFLQSCWKTHPSALVEEKSKGILANMVIIWNTKKNKESLWEKRPDKRGQSVAHFCSCDGLCTHSDADKDQCVIQVESIPLPQCRLLLTRRNYPAASRGSKEPWPFVQERCLKCVWLTKGLYTSISVFPTW